MKTLSRVFVYLRRYPGLASLTLLCALVGTGLVVVFPKATQVIIDDAIRGGQPELLLPMVLLALGAFFVRDFLNSTRIILNNTFEQKVIFDLRSDLYGHIQSLPLPWFDERATGDIMTRIIEDVTSMERVLIDGIEQGTVAVLQVFIVLTMLFWFDAGLALWALLPVPLLAAGAWIYTSTAAGRYRFQRRAVSDMNSLLHDNLAGIRQIKTYVREREEKERFNAASDGVRKATLVVMRIWAFYSPSMAFFASCGLVLVLGLGGSKVLAGSMQIGELVAFLTLAGFLYEPIGRLHQLNQLFQSGRAAADRVFEIMDEPGEPEDSAAASTGRVRGDVQFQKVSFAYSPGAPILNEISLHARPGETIALVGPTGAGKSTLVSMLTRFYEFDEGEILIDKRPIRGMRRADLRRAIGLVTQESFLFNGTIRENLLLGKPDATDEEMLRVLESANALAIVENLPDGLGARVGERGVKLSVGEKQRVSIARALLKDPPVLILDEATASVDASTEKMIQGALDHLMRGRTSFVIAHRLSTVLHADQILVMQHGRIVQYGRHSDLMGQKGLYADLCRNSFLDGTAD